mmetsp:Transcript_101205/g.179733  ORF Transcript_101205/g.179733 Transcript_101205/m.179733 type:complete len:362 (-) Transcript_101205:87-1172(-)
MHSLHADAAWGFGRSAKRKAHFRKIRARPAPTPSRSVRRRCEDCGWTPERGLCACGFLAMDPFRPVDEVIALTALAPDLPQGPGAAFAEFEFSASAKLELRMARQGQIGRHSWPHSMCVLLDDAEVATVEPPRDGHRRSDQPLALPTFSSGHHILQLRAKAPPAAFGRVLDEATEFVLCVVRVQRRSVSEILVECRTRPTFPRNSSYALLHGLEEQGDEAIKCETPWELPLHCPLTKERLREPVRGCLCKHLQCVELEAFLVTSSTTSFQKRWCCPVCDLPLTPGQLAICEMTLHLLKSLPQSLRAASLEQVSSEVQRSVRPRWNREALPLDGSRSSEEPAAAAGWGRRLQGKGPFQADVD